ncbi:MAG TPA: peptidoglycan DD-metalloendopeptidase family protein [Casimicrobiaceae bacterium]|nr:peptidoglycan DD-metalloendopeptidase family protein [Casimicrobiaceae bacterium]
MSALSPYPGFGSWTRQAAALSIAALIVAGCASPRPAPVEDRVALRASGTAQGASRGPSAGETGRPATYTVKRGDTLYQIALDSGLDYRELAAWNYIGNVNRIYAGQVLRLAPPGQPPAGTQIASAAPASGQDGAPVGITYAPIGAPVRATGDTAPATGAAPSVTTTLPDGVTTAPLQSVPPVVAAPVTPPSGQVFAMAPRASPGTAGSVGATAMQANAVAGAGNLKTSPKAIKQPYSDQAVREMTLEASSVPAPPSGGAVAVVPATVAAPLTAQPTAVAQPQVAPAGTAGLASGANDQLNWIWPAKGKVITQFSDTANLKGIDIAGTPGEPVYASAAGRVVYAGSGLRGYGKLIIIKHNATYLSAYAHNQDILVKEGQQVARGQKIADMGDTDANQVKLHFEIRRFGKPMDPEKFLPPA